MTGAMTDYRRGLWMATGAFVIWGLMPLYWHLLKAVPSLQIIAHRIVWSAVLVLGWLFLKQGTRWLRAVREQPRLAGLLALSGLFIAFNWGLYIWAVNAGHVVETSLGYFINPLLNVLLGVVLLRERLRAAQWLAVAIVTAGVLWLTFNYGSFPWIALTLATSFAMYGFIRKLTAIDSLPGLGIESAYLLLPALALLLWGESTGQGHVLDAWWPWTDALLVLGGALTALPLIGFAYAVRRVPLSTVGLLQYLAPTLQLICGVAILGEPFGRDRVIGFVLIWIALAVYAVDGLLRSRRPAVAAG